MDNEWRNIYISFILISYVFISSFPTVSIPQLLHEADRMFGMFAVWARTQDFSVISESRVFKLSYHLCEVYVPFYIITHDTFWYPILHIFYTHLNSYLTELKLMVSVGRGSCLNELKIYVVLM